MKPRSVSVGTPDSDWAARAFTRWRTSPMRARPPSATCTTEAPWEALMPDRSEEPTSELQSLMRISDAVFCLPKIISTIAFDSSTLYIHFCTPSSTHHLFFHRLHTQQHT